VLNERCASSQSTCSGIEVRAFFIADLVRCVRYNAMISAAFSADRALSQRTALK
jgi:hypothetical protein